MGKKDFPAPSLLETLTMSCGIIGQVVGVSYFTYASLMHLVNPDSSLNILKDSQLQMMAASLAFGAYSKVIELDSKFSYIQRLKDLGYKLD